MAPLGWRHHTLIQALLSRGPLKEDDFRSIFSEVTGRTSGSRQQQQQQLFNEYLRKINAELSYVQLELRACRNQYDEDVYYGLVNNVSDDQSKLGTKYSVPQIAFYKGIVEAIIQDADAGGCIFITRALNINLETQYFWNHDDSKWVWKGSIIFFEVPTKINDSKVLTLFNFAAGKFFLVPGMSNSQSQGGVVQIPPAFKNFTLSQKDKTLDQLVKDQWLCSVPDGKIGIGVRSFLDLRSWFRTNEVPACEVCNEAAVKAQVCRNEACNVRLHLYCLKKKFSGQRVERVCSGCGTQWDDSIVKAEAVEKTNNLNFTSQNSQPLKPSMKRRRNADIAGSDASSTAAAVSDVKRVTRSSARLSAN